MNGNEQLSERYRPMVLRELVGQERAASVLGAFALAPGPSAWLLTGDSGVGKTSAALALGKLLSSPMDTIRANGQNVTADWLRTTWDTLALYPWKAGAWRMLIVDEADAMSHAAQKLMLSYLEDIPTRAIVVLTSNDRVREEWEPRLWSRLRILHFATPTANGAAAAVARRLVDIARGEGYALPVAHAARYLTEAHGNIRAAIEALDVDMIAGTVSE